MHSQYFGFLVTADTASTHNSSTWRFCAAAIVVPDPQHFGVRYCRYSLYLEVFRSSVLRVLQVLAVFRSLVLRVLPVLAVPKYSRYTRNMEYTWTLCAQAVSIIIHAHCFAENMHKWSPRVGDGANYLWWEQLEHLRVLAVIRDWSTRSISRFYTAATALFLKYLGVRYCGYCLYSGSCTPHTPNTRGIWPFQHC